MIPSFKAGVAQLVEHHLAKVAVESSNLFARSIFLKASPEIGGAFLGFLTKSSRKVLAAQWVEEREAASSHPSPLPIFSEHKFCSTLNKTCAKQRSPISPSSRRKERSLHRDAVAQQFIGRTRPFPPCWTRSRRMLMNLFFGSSPFCGKYVLARLLNCRAGALAGVAS